MLDEAGQRRIAAGRILVLAADQHPPLMLGEHDHDRIDAREMLGLAGAGICAPSRPGTARSARRSGRNKDGRYAIR